jgi:hypothetical protein
MQRSRDARTRPITKGILRFLVGGGNEGRTLSWLIVPFPSEESSARFPSENFTVSRSSKPFCKLIHEDGASAVVGFDIVGEKKHNFEWCSSYLSRGDPDGVLADTGIGQSEAVTRT